MQCAVRYRGPCEWSCWQLWVKGLTSGDYLELVEIRVNCEQNSLLYMVPLSRRLPKGRLRADAGVRCGGNRV